MKNKLTITAAMLALALAITACGSQQESSTDSANETDTAASEVVIQAINYKFDQEEYRIKAGEPIKVVLQSTGNHGLEINELGLKLTPQNTSQVITPKAGTYEFECTILCGSGHNDMKAKLIVE